jgi:outer membrane protein TolC
MEELVRRSQVELAAQGYFEAKRLRHAALTANLARDYAAAREARVERRLRQRQVHDVELTSARVDNTKSRVMVEEVERASRLAQRRLGQTLHTSRLLVPQGGEPVSVKLDGPYSFDLAAEDLVDLDLVADLPQSREEAVEMARRKRVEVRILIIGLNIARLGERRDLLRLLGLGSLPLGLSFKNTTIANGGPATLGTIFGTLYDVPVVDIGFWSNVRRARLEVVRSQLDLEKVLLEVEEDAGNAWDRLRQAEYEYGQKQREEALNLELRERSGRMLDQKQAIPLDVQEADLALSQAQTNRWTAWYNLQLARLDLLRSTEMLLDYLRDAGIEAPPQVIVADAKPSLWHRLTCKIRPAHTHGEVNP